MEAASPIRFAVMVAAALAPGACGGSGSGGSDETQGAPAADGAQAYTVRCSYCHDVPNGIGAALTPGVLAAYGTVGRLDSYLRVAMPHESPGSLPSAEYEAILRYLIESRKLAPGGRDPATLPDSVRLRADGS